MPAGAELALEVAWPDCPRSTTCGDGACGADEDATGCPDDCADAAPCAGAEPYPLYDAEADALVAARERISATWFTPRGRFAEPRTGRAADDVTPWAANTWTAPATPGDLWITVVLRDDRGGVGAATWWLTVTEP